MVEGTFSEKIYIAAEWLLKIAYLQLLFITFTIAGLGILGIFPALAAMLAVVRKWIIKGDDGLPLHKVYFAYFRQFFAIVNLLGYALTLFTSCIILYIYWFNQIGGIWGNVIIYLLFFILFFVFVLWIYWLPVVVHYEVKGLHIFKNALLIGLLRPLHTFSFLLLILVLYFWSSFIPGFLPIINVSLLGIGWMGIAWHAFNKFDKKIAM